MPIVLRKGQYDPKVEDDVPPWAEKMMCHLTNIDVRLTKLAAEKDSDTFPQRPPPSHLEHHRSHHYPSDNKHWLTRSYDHNIHHSPRDDYYSHTSFSNNSPYHDTQCFLRHNYDRWPMFHDEHSTRFSACTILKPQFDPRGVQAPTLDRAPIVFTTTWGPNMGKHLTRESQESTSIVSCNKCRGYGHVAAQCPTRSFYLDEPNLPSHLIEDPLYHIKLEEEAYILIQC